MERETPKDHAEISVSTINDYNASESLLHLLTSQAIQDEKADACVHPSANLDMLTGPHRGPAIPISMLEENPRICITCGVDFKSRASLHAHLMRHRHILGQLEQFTRLPKYECRSCEGGINCASMLKHKCFSNQQNDIRTRIKALDQNGSPLVCILCRGRLFPSRVHLTIHIIVAHSVHRDPYRCVFCKAQFQSENLMMQEVHAFDCHAPELFMLTRKACFKMIRNAQGGVANASVPFTCFYDATKLEGGDLKSGTRPKRLADTTPSEEDYVNVSSTKKRICTATFNTLDEYTAHLCCFHGAVSQERAFSLEVEDPVEEARRVKFRTSRVPGPTVRELLKEQAAGHHAPLKSEDEFGPPALTTSKPTKVAELGCSARVDRAECLGPGIRQRTIPNMSVYRLSVVATGPRMREMCRICLERFPDEHKLNGHIAAYHAPETRTRLKHLADKAKLSGLLDIDLLCTECYIMFPDTLAIQVHMMVSHASKDWRHCGLCGYEFYSENGGTPNHLRLVKFSSSSHDSSVSARLPRYQLVSDGGGSMDAWPLPAELMWRMIMTHETRHRERLFQPRPVPYLPLLLLDQLINGKAIQAVIAANWLVRKAQEEIEGVQASDEPLTNVPELITTEEAFSDGPNKIKLLGVDEVAVEEAKASLISKLKKNGGSDESIYDNNGRLPSIRLSTTGSRLPPAIMRKFTELGELNAARQVELDFVENL